MITISCINQNLLIFIIILLIIIIIIVDYFTIPKIGGKYWLQSLIRNIFDNKPKFLDIKSFPGSITFPA